MEANPKAGYKSTEFWVMVVIAGFTLFKAITGEGPSAGETQQVTGATAQLVEALLRLVEVAGPILYGIYYTVSRGKLKSNTVRFISELAKK